MQELETVSHYFVNHLSVTEEFSVADYEQFCLQKLEELFIDNDIVVVCGGTGLYLRALVQGLDAIPAVPAEIRNRIRLRAEVEGIQWAQEILRKVDVDFCATESFYNTNRVLRALEVFETTGKTISSYQQKNLKIRDFKCIQICLDIPREQLYYRINERVDAMMVDGLLEEVKGLIPFKNLNALNTVGYKELFSHLEDEISLDTAVELIKQHTRQYAKRQKTWFTKEENMLFCTPSLSEVIQIIESKLA